jgi:hypothetical protein
MQLTMIGAVAMLTPIALRLAQYGHYFAFH